MNQFFYTRLENGVGHTDSFNVDSVVRTFEFDGKLLVQLNDGREEAVEKPMYSNTGKEKGVQRVREWRTTVVSLEGEDINRFRAYFSCDKFMISAKNTEPEQAKQLELDLK